MKQRTNRQELMAKAKSRLSDNEDIAFELGADFLAEIRIRIEFDEAFWNDPKTEEWRKAVAGIKKATYNIYKKMKEAK